MTRSHLTSNSRNFFSRGSRKLNFLRIKLQGFLFNVIYTTLPQTVFHFLGSWLTFSWNDPTQGRQRKHMRRKRGRVRGGSDKQEVDKQQLEWSSTGLMWNKARKVVNLWTDGHEEELTERSRRIKNLAQEKNLLRSRRRTWAQSQRIEEQLNRTVEELRRDRMEWWTD